MSQNYVHSLIYKSLLLGTIFSDYANVMPFLHLGRYFWSSIWGIYIGLHVQHTLFMSVVVAPTIRILVH